MVLPRSGLLPLRIGVVASGGHLWACRMSADMMQLTKNDLHDAVEGIINAADFIELTNGAQLLFI